MNEGRGSRAFWLLNLANFGDGICYFGILNLITPYLSDDIGFGDKYGHPVVSFFTASVTLFMLVGGSYSDRIGVRRAITQAQLLQFLGRTLLGLAFLVPGPRIDRELVACAALFLMGAGSGLLQPALYAGVKDYTDPAKAAMGFSWLYAIMNLGSFAENFISPFLRTSDPFIGPVHGLGLGIHGVFLALAGITLFLLLANLLFFTKRVEDVERIVVVGAEGGVTPRRSFWDSPIFEPRFAFFIFILLPVRTLFAHQFLTVPDYILRCFPKEVGDKLEWFNGINPLVVAVGVPLATRLTGNVPVLRMMIIGTTVSALTTFVLVLPPDFHRLIFYVFMFSVGESLWSSRFLEYVAKLAPPGQIGAYMAVGNIPWFLAKMTTGLYSGRLMAHFIPQTGPQEPGALWMIYGFIACVSPIGLLVAGSWLTRAREGDTALS